MKNKKVGFLTNYSSSKQKLNFADSKEGTEMTEAKA